MEMTIVSHLAGKYRRHRDETYISSTGGNKGSERKHKSSKWYVSGAERHTRVLTKDTHPRKGIER